MSTQDTTKFFSGNLQTQHISESSCKDGIVKSTTWKELTTQPKEIEEIVQRLEAKEGEKSRRNNLGASQSSQPIEKETMAVDALDLAKPTPMRTPSSKVSQK